MSVKIDRRQLLAGATATALLPRAAAAGLHSGTAVGNVPPLTGWNHLPMGWGGFTVGSDIAATDGTMVCRTDVGNIYRWTGTTADRADPTKRWQSLLSFASLAGTVTPGQRAFMAGGKGAWEFVIAPSLTTRFYAIFSNSFPETAVKIPTNYAAYVTDDSGATWIKSDLVTNNADSNGITKAHSYKIAVDPNNPNVAYVGLPHSNGQSYLTWYTTDGGRTYTGISGIPQAKRDPGGCGICVDGTATTTGVGGLIVSYRVIAPSSGVDIYESFDGGLSFASTGFVTVFGSTAFSVYAGRMNRNNGIFYVVVNGQLWRYIKGATAGGGTWDKLSDHGLNKSWPYRAGAGTITLDQRVGQEGFLTVFTNGLGGAAVYATNADAINPATISWTAGHMASPVFHSPSYDVQWLATMKSTGYIGSTNSLIDPDGVSWWFGFQGAGWYFARSDFTTPVRYEPNGATATYSIVTSRGDGESAVSQDILRPPGGAYPVVAPQDLSMMRGTWTDYPTNLNRPKDPGANSRLDADTLAYALSDPSFVICKRDGEFTFNGHYTAYNTNYGEPGSWTNLLNQPDYMYHAVADIEVTDNRDGTGTITVYDVKYGTVQLDQEPNVMVTNGTTLTSSGTGGVGDYTISAALTQGSGIGCLFNGREYVATIVYRSSGAALTVEQLLAGGPVTSGLTIYWIGRQLFYRGISSYGTGSGGTGTYILSNTVHSTLSRQIAFLNKQSYGGQVCALTKDNVFLAPYGTSNYKFKPVYCTDFSSGSPTWQFCTGLPEFSWSLRSYSNGSPIKYFAGDPNNAGVAYAFALAPSTSVASVLYKTTDYGATWSPVNRTNLITGANSTGMFMYCVPGFPDHIWLGIKASADPNKFWHSEDGGVSFTHVNLPARYQTLQQFTMGKALPGASYPTLYMIGYGNYNTRFSVKYYYSTDKGVTWKALGRNLGLNGDQSDLPPLNQINGLQGLSGDWDVAGLVYAVASSMGFLYFYDPTMT